LDLCVLGGWRRLKQSHMLSLSLACDVRSAWYSGRPNISRGHFALWQASISFGLLTNWHGRPSLSSKELITAREVFVTTMVNPKGLIVAIVLIPIDTSVEIPYLTIVALAAVIAGILWIGVGAIVESNLQPVGKVQFLSRIGSAVMISFAITLQLLHS
jgi:hypothetical protein